MSNIALAMPDDNQPRNTRELTVNEAEFITNYYGIDYNDVSIHADSSIHVDTGNGSYTDITESMLRNLRSLQN